MHFDGLIFDLDGTLWDCSAASTEAFNLAYETFGLSRRVTRDFVQAFSGKPVSECDAILLEGVPESIRDEVSRCFDDFEIAAIRRHAKDALYDGVAEGLIELARRYLLYVVSNCGERYLTSFHEQTSIGGHFRDSESFGRTLLPKADNIRLIVERCEIGHPCYIGDTEGDEEAARRAGVPFFHAGYGFGKPVGTPRSFRSFAELTKFFLQAL